MLEYEGADEGSDACLPGTRYCWVPAEGIVLCAECTEGGLTSITDAREKLREAEEDRLHFLARSLGETDPDPFWNDPY